MKKKTNDAVRASALQIALAAALIFTSAILLASNFTPQSSAVDPVWVAAVAGTLDSSELPLATPTPTPAMTFTVTSTDDTGGATCGPTCTLRQAINASNANPPPSNTTNLISFNIPGSGVQTITPASALPTISDPVVIDGYTQPGSSANTLAAGDNAVLLIELNAAATGAGLNITGAGSGSTIRGLVINRGSDGIQLASSATNCTIEGNFIGADATGTNGLGNLRGIANFGCDNLLIGGTTPAAPQHRVG